MIFRDTRGCRGADGCLPVPTIVTFVRKRRKDQITCGKIVAVNCRYKKGDGCLGTLMRNPNGEPTMRCRYADKALGE